MGFIQFLNSKTGHNIIINPFTQDIECSNCDLKIPGDIIVQAALPLNILDAIFSISCVSKIKIVDSEVLKAFKEAREKE